MTKIHVLPHERLCPNGLEFDAPNGETVCDALLRNHIAIEHACEKSCACTTCHVIVREGLNSLDEQEEKEEDMLDMAWRLTPLFSTAPKNKTPNAKTANEVFRSLEEIVVGVKKFFTKPIRLIIK